MKAIVMAGGEGTRLRPMTSLRPKPMVELFGRPLLAYTVEKLRRLGVTDIRFTLRYMPEAIMDAFGDGESLGVRLTYTVEEQPLGTAGGVRACRDFLGDEPALILSGDAVWDLDLTPALALHRERGAEATLVLYGHPDPTAFGLVLTDREGRVTAFSEKPSWERVVTDRVNTGIYVLSPSALDLVPGEGPFDFGRDLFPALLREGRSLWGVQVPGYWCDVGSAPAYLRCCRDILHGRVDLDVGENAADGLRDRGVTVQGPVFVSPTAHVSPGALLGPDTVLGPDTRVGRGARICGSVVNGAAVGEDCRLRGAILCRGASLGRRVQAAPGCVLGEDCAVGDGAVLSGDVRIYPRRAVKAGAAVTRSLTDRPEDRPLVFSDDRRIRADAASLLDGALALGAALGRVPRVALAGAGQPQARVVAGALACGVNAAGAEAIRTDCGFEAELAVLGRIFGFDRCVFVRASGEIALTVLGPSGVPLDAPDRAALEAAAREGLLPAATGAGEMSAVSGSTRAYVSELCRAVRALAAPGRAIRLAVTGRGAENRALRCVLAALGFEVVRPGPGIPALAALPGGFRFTARDERGRTVDAPTASLLGAEAALRLGLDALALTPEEPEALRRLAVRYGCRVLESSEPAGRALYAGQLVLRDGLFGAAATAAAMSAGGVEMASLLDSLPSFAVAERSVEISSSRSSAMRRLTEDHAELRPDPGRGAVYSTPHGGVRVRPDPRRDALLFRAEAESMEAAQELLDRFVPQGEK